MTTLNLKNIKTAFTNVYLELGIIPSTQDLGVLQHTILSERGLSYLKEVADYKKCSLQQLIDDATTMLESIVDQVKGFNKEQKAAWIALNDAIQEQHRTNELSEKLVDCFEVYMDGTLKAKQMIEDGTFAASASDEALDMLGRIIKSALLLSNKLGFSKSNGEDHEERINKFLQVSRFNGPIAMIATIFTVEQLTAVKDVAVSFAIAAQEANGKGHSDFNIPMDIKNPFAGLIPTSVLETV